MNVNKTDQQLCFGVTQPNLPVSTPTTPLSLQLPNTTQSSSLHSHHPSLTSAKSSCANNIQQNLKDPDQLNTDKQIYVVKTTPGVKNVDCKICIFKDLDYPSAHLVQIFGVLLYYIHSIL